MARNMASVMKTCRRLGLEPQVLGISKKPSKRKLTSTHKKVSEYGLQLREKQKVKFIYGVLEKQFRLYYEKANKQKGVTGDNLLILLERRIDNVLFRMGFARTRKEARQIVRHNHIKINGKKVNIPSFLVSADDVIEFKDSYKKSQGLANILDETSSRLVPAWLESDKDNHKGKVLAIPTRENIDIPINETLIIEFYSK